MTTRRSTESTNRAPVSDRATNTFDNTAKTDSRKGNLLAVVEQADELWDDEGHKVLRCAWAELTGKTGNLTLEMLTRAGVLAEKGFVGIDLDEGTIASHAKSYPDYTWITGDIYDLLQAPELGTVGILNLDGYDMVGAPAVGARGRLVADLARRAIERLGAFALFWNADLDAPRRLGLRPADALERHVQVIAGALQGAITARMRLDAPDLLRPSEAEKVAEPDFVGPLRNFQVYRGSATGHRMANLRLILR